MKVEVKTIEQSSHGKYPLLTTLQMKYPRFIHAEVLTHRVFSRNSSSSRAIPIKKIVNEVRKDPATPAYWGSNKPGMQAGEELKGWRLVAAKAVWFLAMRVACTLSLLLHRIGLHKQHANRITEPFQYIHTVVTATDWDNFMELRNHKDAQPEIKMLAEAMEHALVFTDTTKVNRGGWHVPYVTQEEREQYADSMEELAKVSAARCARVSYTNHDGTKTTFDQDMKLFNMLAGNRPMHLSPLEHQATPGKKGNTNFNGWNQFRSVVEKQSPQ